MKYNLHIIALHKDHELLLPCLKQTIQELAVIKECTCKPYWKIKNRNSIVFIIDIKEQNMLLLLSKLFLFWNIALKDGIIMDATSSHKPIVKIEWCSLTKDDE